MKLTSALFACAALTSAVNAHKLHDDDSVDALKDELRAEVEEKANSFLDLRWESFKQTLDNEALFREFSGEMFALVKDGTSQLSALWKIEDFASLVNIGGGLGPVYGADSIAYDNSRQHLVTVGWSEIAHVGETAGFSTFLIDTESGRASASCKVTFGDDAPADGFVVLDIDVGRTGIFVWVADGAENSLYLIDDDQGIDFSVDGNCICEAALWEENADHAPLNTQIADQSETNGAFFAKQVSRLGEELFFSAGEAGIANFYGLDSIDVGNSTVLNVVNSAGVEFRAGAFNTPTNAFWLTGTSDDFNFLCGWVLSHVQDDETTAAACFRLPAVDGLAIKD